MSDAGKLRDNVHRLARAHAGTIHTDTGPLYKEANPLIMQLWQAITPSQDGGTGGSPDGKRLPLNADAYDAYQLIQEQARRAVEQCTLRPRHGKLPATIIRYGAAIQAFGANEISQAKDLTNEWIRVCQTILTPTRPRRPTQQPCPACTQLWDTTNTERRWAVTVWAGSNIPVTEWEAYCSNCEAAWIGEDLAYYLRAIDTPGTTLATG